MPRYDAMHLKSSLKKREVTVNHFYAVSTNADRAIGGFGDFKKGVWVEVPERIYKDISNAIKSSGGEDIGWQVKVEAVKLEV